MRISLSHPSRLGHLIEFLCVDATAMIRQASDTEIEIWFTGSLNSWAQQRELELRLRSWLAANPDVVASITD